MPPRKSTAPPVPAVEVRTAAQLLTTQQVAAQLQVDAKTVRRIIASRELPAYRVGRTFRVHPDHLAAYISGLAIAPDATLALGTTATA